MMSARYSSLYYFIIETFHLFRFGIKSQVVNRYPNCFLSKRLRFSKYPLLTSLISKAENCNLKFSLLDFPRVEGVQNEKGDPKIWMEGSWVEFNSKYFIQRCNDIELQFFIHRFHWLIKYLLEAPCKRRAGICLDIILTWIEIKNKPHAGGNDSYSISERLMNWIYLLSLARQFLSKEELCLFDKVWLSINEQLSDLVLHLEVRGGDTNNHILNNARCVYILGTIFKSPAHVKVGETLLKIFLEKFVLKGVLLEGSSHYQLLYCTRFLEIWHFSKKNPNREFQIWLEDICSEIYSVSIQLYSFSGSYPCFGDISPDVSEHWLENGLSLDQIYTRYSWPYLYKKMLKGELLERIQASFSPWCFHRHGDFEIWLCLKDSTPMWHGHDDQGVIEIWFRGKPLFFDPGRSHYSNLGNEMLLRKEHQTLNCLETPMDLSLTGRYARNKAYRRFSEAKLLEHDKAQLTAQFKSYDHSFQWKREILFVENGLKINDVVLDSRLSSFTLAHSWNVKERGELDTKKNVYCIHLDNVSLSLLSSKNHGSMMLNLGTTHYSRKYGERSQCERISIFAPNCKSGDQLCTEIKIGK